jgi:hypothetical protein
LKVTRTPNSETAQLEDTVQSIISQEALPLKRLKELVGGVRETLLMVGQLSQISPLYHQAESLWEHLRRQTPSWLAPALEEDVQFVASSLFAAHHSRINYAQLSSALAEAFLILHYANRLPILYDAYIGHKLTLLRKKLNLEDTQDFSSNFTFLTNFIFREYQILLRMKGQIEESDPSLETALHTATFIAKSLNLLVLGLQNLAVLTQAACHKIARQKGPEANFWRGSLDKVGFVLEEARVLELLDEAPANYLRGVFADPICIFSDYVLMEVETSFAEALEDKAKPVELEEKFNTLRFPEFLTVLQDSFDVCNKLGFGLRIDAWTKSANRFVQSVCQRVEDCLIIFENYFYEGLNSSQDVYLRFNVGACHNYLVKETPFQQLFEKFEIISGDFTRFTVTKKIMVSLLELLFNKYSDLEVFSGSLTDFFGVGTSKELFKPEDNILSDQLRRLLGMPQSEEMPSSVRKYIRSYKNYN